jgi:hypothetical protein
MSDNTQPMPTPEILRAVVDRWICHQLEHPERDFSGHRVAWSPERGFLVRDDEAGAWASLEDRTSG